MVCILREFRLGGYPEHALKGVHKKDSDKSKARSVGHYWHVN